MEKVKMSTAAELKKANEMTNFKKYKAKVFEALASDTYGLSISQLATVCKLSAKTIKLILAELEVEKNGDVYLLKNKQPVQSAPEFPIYDNWLSKNMTTLRQATAHLNKNDVNDIIEVAGRLIWEASKTQGVPSQKYFSHDFNGDGFKYHDSLEEAKKEAEVNIDWYRERVADGHHVGEEGEFFELCYGVVIASAGYTVDDVVTDEHHKNDEFTKYEVGTEILSLHFNKCNSESGAEG